MTIYPMTQTYGYDEVTCRFSGKERDVETGLDYFGARYFSGAQGRFTSPDPLGANLLRVLNPQRWNMYAYAVNNPLLYTDPDGRDAVVANFNTLALGAGHLGAISVHRDGSATYGDYAPRGGGKPIWGGVYQVVSLGTKLTFESDGIPTATSLAALAGEVAKLDNVDPSTVSLAYYKTSDAETASLDQYLESLRVFKDSSLSWLSLYVVGAHDCAEVCNIAMSKAGIGRGSEGADIPNLLFNWMYVPNANASYSGETGTVKKNKNREKKPDVHSTFKPCASGDADCGGN